MAAVNEEVATVLRHLPADGTLEDVQYGLYVLEKVKRGLADVEDGRTLTQEEVEQRLAAGPTDGPTGLVGNRVDTPSGAGVVDQSVGGATVSAPDRYAAVGPGTG